MKKQNRYAFTLVSSPGSRSLAIHRQRRSGNVPTSPHLLLAFTCLLNNEIPQFREHDCTSPSSTPHHHPTICKHDSKLAAPSLPHISPGAPQRNSEELQLLPLRLGHIPHQQRTPCLRRTSPARPRTIGERNRAREHAQECRTQCPSAFLVQSPRARIASPVRYKCPRGREQSKAEVG